MRAVWLASTKTSADVFLACVSDVSHQKASVFVVNTYRVSDSNTAVHFSSGIVQTKNPELTAFYFFISIILLSVLPRNVGSRLRL